MSGRRPNYDLGEPDLWSNGSVFMGQCEPISIDPGPHIPLQQTTDKRIGGLLLDHRLGWLSGGYGVCVPMHYFPLSLFRPKDRRNPHGNRGDIIPPLNTPTLWSIMRLASVSPSIRTTLSATLPTILAPLRSIPAASPTSPVASVPA